MGMAVRWKILRNVREKMVCDKRKGGSRWTVPLSLPKLVWCYRLGAPGPQSSRPNDLVCLSALVPTLQSQKSAAIVSQSERMEDIVIGFPDFLKGLEDFIHGRTQCFSSSPAKEKEAVRLQKLQNL